jgi:hypothetical protein
VSLPYTVLIVKLVMFWFFYYIFNIAHFVASYFLSVWETNASAKRQLYNSHLTGHVLFVVYGFNIAHFAASYFLFIWATYAGAKRQLFFLYLTEYLAKFPDHTFNVNLSSSFTDILLELLATM